MQRSAVLLCLSLLLGACSGTETIPDDTARFAAGGHSRYAWRSEPLSQSGNSRDLIYQADPVIRASVDERLAELGYRLVDSDSADFLVEYFAAESIGEGQIATSASNVYPYPTATINRLPDGATVDNAYALGGARAFGNLVLVFVEKTSTELLWRVRISKLIEDANRINERAVRAAVRQGLATLPEASPGDR